MTATPPILVTLLKAEAETPTLRTPTTGLLSIQETDSNGTITQATFQPRRKDAYGPEIATGKCEFLHLDPNRAEIPSAHPDPDTAFNGLDGPFEYWESDHTALIHVLWTAKHQGLTLQGDDEEIARLIRHSRWHAATKAQAVEQAQEAR